MDSQSLSELGPIPAEVLYALLVTVMLNQGGVVTVRVPELLEAARATWTWEMRRGPGPGETTWTIEKMTPDAIGGHDG